MIKRMVVKCKLLLGKDSFVRKKKMIITILVTALITAVATALILIFGFWIWFSRICTTEMTLLQSSRMYHATTPGMPSASARLYYLGRDRFLLVLMSRSSKYPEGYYLNMFNGEIGLPDFPDYIPLYKYCLVDRRIYDGFPTLGALKADLDVKKDKDEVHIRIKGFKEKEPGINDEELMREHMPIAYQSNIVIKKRAETRREGIGEGIGASP